MMLPLLAQALAPVQALALVDERTARGRDVDQGLLRKFPRRAVQLADVLGELGDLLDRSLGALDAGTHVLGPESAVAELVDEVVVDLQEVARQRLALEEVRHLRLDALVAARDARDRRGRRDGDDQRVARAARDPADRVLARRVERGAELAPDLVLVGLGHLVDLQHDLGFAAVEGNKILVHGGGKSASKLGQRLGVPAQMIEGRRVTDAATLEIVTMVYGGLINKKLVAQLQAEGCNAIGLTGADANIIPAQKRKHPQIDFGYVGDLNTDMIDSTTLLSLLDAKMSPVFCALTHDQKGQLLNTNADTIAAELAKSLSKDHTVQLIYCFEKKGVLRDAEDDNSYIPKMNHEEYQLLSAEKVIHSGMIPKLHNAFEALQSGVDSVHIKHAHHLLNDTGTVLVA